MLASVLVGCSQEPAPISQNRTSYVGIWEQGNFGEGTKYQYLQISASGYLASARFAKVGGTTTCSVVGKIPITSITSSKISTSALWVINMDFTVNRPPKREGNTERMTIDGNELIKTDARTDGFKYTWSCSEAELVRSVAD